MKHCLRGWEHVPELRFCAKWTENPGPWVKLVGWFSSPVSFPPCDPGRARAASTLSSPRPKRTATPWTRAAACSPASRRWCITTATSACLSTAPSTWPCCTQCLASSDSASRQLRYTNQTHLWAGTDKKRFHKVLPDMPKRVPPLPPFSAVCNYPMIHPALCLDITHCLLFYFIFFTLQLIQNCCFSCELGGSAAQTMTHFGWLSLSQSGTWSQHGWDVFFLTDHPVWLNQRLNLHMKSNPFASGSLYPSGGSAGSLHQHVDTKNLFFLPSLKIGGW